LVSERIHDSETDTGELVVRSLLASQCGEWASWHLSYLRTAGTDNAMWRLDRDGKAPLVVRLPRTQKAAKAIAKELSLLPQIAGLLPFPTPEVRHQGSATEQFPHPWAVFNWLDGVDAWSAKDQLDDPHADDFATDMANAVLAIRSLNHTVADLADRLPTRRDGERGGPLAAVLDNLDRWLSDPRWNATDLIDVVAVRRSAAESSEAAPLTVSACAVHGDLLPGNILVSRCQEDASSRLGAVIDWGGAGIGDPAQDLAPAWALLDTKARRTFREVIDADDETWLRARGCELEHAVGGVLYYVPRRHPLGDIMTRTLSRILADS
jgi:aminoglycoside phosphotransferase (APT) family kinase protein